MKLHCHGTTGYHPSPTRHTACYYLPELSLVLDAGTGVCRLIEQLRREPMVSLDILLSHAHLDHVVGLTFLLDAMAITDLTNIRIIGTPDKLEAVREHLYNELLFPVEPNNMEFLPLDGARGTLPLKTCSVDWFPLEHPGGSIGFVITAQGKRVAYITDTVSRPIPDYLAKIRGVDLLLHECYFTDEHQDLAIKTGHSWISAVTSIVRQAQPKKTALIHINPLSELLDAVPCMNHEQRDQLRMLVAEDGMILDI